MAHRDFLEDSDLVADLDMSALPGGFSHGDHRNTMCSRPAIKRLLMTLAA